MTDEYKDPIHNTAMRFALGLAAPFRISSTTKEIAIDKSSAREKIVQLAGVVAGFGAAYITTRFPEAQAVLTPTLCISNGIDAIYHGGQALEYLAQKAFNPHGKGHVNKKVVGSYIPDRESIVQDVQIIYDPFSKEVNTD